MCEVAYYSTSSRNTERFVERLGVDAMRVSARESDMPTPTRPYILICPTYGDPSGRGIVPKAVIKFLNNPHRRGLLRGVVGAGNRNFGHDFARAADEISFKCRVPILHRIELAGTCLDVEIMHDVLKNFGEVNARNNH